MNIIIAFFLYSEFVTCKEQIKCRDDNGLSVDWLYGYKIPVLQYETDPELRSGYGYMYMTANTKRKWKLSKKSINDSKSFLGNTLSPLYQTDIRQDLLYLAYNDDPPSSHAASSFGHAKGVVMLKGHHGLWLVHSSPRFPKEYMTVEKDQKKTTTKNNYFYPFSAVRNGQSFLCLSLKSEDMNKIGIILEYIKPKVYDYHIPHRLRNNYPNLTRAAEGKYHKGHPFYHKTTLVTAGGKKFTSFAKTSKFQKDLYRDWLTEELKSSLEVETWRNGNGEALPSGSKSAYVVSNIKKLEFKVQGHKLMFPNSKDHSKWAVTYKSERKVTCIGDINRMKSQFRRGGGTICHDSHSIWSSYHSAIAEIEGVKPNETNEWPGTQFTNQSTCTTKKSQKNSTNSKIKKTR